MNREQDDAKIGLLVALTLALFLGFLFQRSLRAILKKEFHIQMRLENASELAEGTEVQLQGLRVGQVESVQLTRDGVNYRFLATLGLRDDILLWQGTQAEVVAKPLGGCFVDLQLPPPQDRVMVLGPGSILAGTTGPTLVTLLAATDTLVRNLGGGVEEARDQFHRKGLNLLLENPQVAQILNNILYTLNIFEKLGKDGQGLVRHGENSLADMDHSLAKLETSLASVENLVATRSGDLDEIVRRLASTLKETEKLGKDFNGLLQEAGPSGAQAVKALERNLKASEELLELLRAKPNRIVWGKPGAAETAAAARKVQEARQAQEKASENREK